MKNFNIHKKEEALFGRSVDDFLNEQGFLFTDQEITTQGKKYIIQVEIPDFAKEELVLSFEKDLLMLRGFRISYIKQYGIPKKIKDLVFQRSFVCPEDIAPNTIKASYIVGYLTIELPRQTISSHMYGHYLPVYKRIPIKDKQKISLWEKCKLFFKKVFSF